ncbi:hypothetical protein RHMOL_Rhmol03G0053500 [Rhododendron molle]|uniref:Uncharacterized protein n=1 Tax=Rhododendron molle TaxID=49168 RepID=A0ACC0PCD1_RHOML|nr:hypothetical protein RHMOL_Rhmol03G0053500 [Rhododendron molle]
MVCSKRWVSIIFLIVMLLMANEMANKVVEALLCQVGGDQACSDECVDEGYLNGGFCDDTQTCFCYPDV